MIEVITEKCIGFGACIRACAYEAITIEAKLAEINPDKCTLCGACVQACPFDAILIRKKTSVSVNKDDYQASGSLPNSGRADRRSLFRAPGQRAAILPTRWVVNSHYLFGSELNGMAEELIAYGADQVIHIDDPALKHSGMNAITEALSKTGREIPSRQHSCRSHCDRPQLHPPGSHQAAYRAHSRLHRP